MLNFTSIQKNIANKGRLRITPPLLISTFLSFFPHIGGKNYLEFGGLQSIEIMYSVPIGIILGIGTIGYFKIAYQKEWFEFSHKSKFQKYFRICSFAFLGLVATLIPYYLGVGNYFFGAIDLMAGSQNSQSILYLAIWTAGISFIVGDMFNSLDGKSGILFRNPSINHSPIKNYHSTDYKIKKFFNL